MFVVTIEAKIFSSTKVLNGFEDRISCLSLVTYKNLRYTHSHIIESGPLTKNHEITKKAPAVPELSSHSILQKCQNSALG